MAKSVLYNPNIGFEHQKWKEEIIFWKRELKSLNIRLSELISRWENKEVLVQIGNYQRQIILYEDIIEDLLESIEQQETRNSTKFNLGLFRGDAQLLKIHIELRSRMEVQRDLFSDLKKSLFRFIDKYL